MHDSFEEFGLVKKADVAPPPFAPPKEVVPPPAALADVQDDSELGADLASGQKKGRRAKGRKKLKKGQSEFDSPLILLGGGVLVLLILIAAVVWYLVNRDTGDALLASANEQFKGGSYSQAIDSYGRFIETFPNHARISEARVQLAVAEIRRVTEGATDFQKSLAVAEEEIRRVEDEERFLDVQNEIAALLERIVRGLAEQAVAAEGTEAIGQRVAATEEALRLINNTKYVPKSQRPVEVILEVRQMLELVERRRAEKRRGRRHSTPWPIPRNLAIFGRPTTSIAILSSASRLCQRSVGKGCGRGNRRSRACPHHLRRHAPKTSRWW